MHGLADDRRHRQRLREVRVVAQVLHRVDQGELEAGQVAVALEHLPHHHLEDAGVHGARRDHLVQLGDRQAGLRGGGERLGRRRGDRLRDEVVDELQHDAVPRRPGVDDVLAERLQHRLQVRERRVVGADHDVEPALLGLHRRARERRVDEAHALRGEVVAHLRRRRGLARRRVDDDHPAARHRRDALGPVDDLLDLRRPGDAQEHDVGVARHVRVGLSLLRPGGQQVLERLAVAVGAHRERKALGDEVLRDAVAHQADADEADAWFAHWEFPFGRLRIAELSRSPSARRAPSARAGARARSAAGRCRR